MDSKCFLFEGQGAQQQGMGKDIYEKFSAARSVFNSGSEVTGVDLANLCFETQADVLNQTKNSQLAIFTVSMAIFSILKEKGIFSEYYAGFSLGECSALCASGVFPIEDGFKIVQKRGELMQRCAESQSGAMYAIIGLGDDIVEEVCKESDGYVIAANYNCPSQIVIAGDEKSAENAAYICKEKGALKAVRLPVNGAFHTNHMAFASEEFKTYLQRFKFSKPNGVLFSNVYGTKLNDADINNLPDYLAKQMVSPVLWKNEIEEIAASGNISFYEIGCGKTLSGFNRKINRALKTVNLSSSDNLLELPEEL